MVAAGAGDRLPQEEASLELIEISWFSLPRARETAIQMKVGYSPKGKEAAIITLIIGESKQRLFGQSTFKWTGNLEMKTFWRAANLTTYFRPVLLCKLYLSLSYLHHYFI